ncbi:EAL and modified HD-GYP domain-containing signal transduction protein [Oxalobacteraceae bacterium GrIS 1.11]
MSAFETSQFPLAGLQAVANARNEWVAVTVQLPPGGAIGTLATVLGYPDVFAALAPLACIVDIADPCAIGDSLLQVLPPRNTIFCMPAALFADKKVQEKCLKLHDDGYRILVDGAGAVPCAAVGALSFDCGAALPQWLPLLALPGPHLARNVDDVQRLAACRALGFSWFSGNYALRGRAGAPDDGSSRKRLLALLGLLARDADARELESLFKQDPALSYHLLKLVNSAAFALSTPINRFSQAINLLGRRQLQRWLQLLLYVGGQEDGIGNALLPLAAVRAAQMEMLCKIAGGDRDQQDSAFMVGVFSLLDVLLGMPMGEIVGALQLDGALELALLERGGALGRMLALTEMRCATADALSAVGIDGETYWRSLLQAYQWAIQVSRNL